MDIAAVMDELAAQLKTITGLVVYDFPPGSIVLPAAVVSYPDVVTFDATYRRGMDRAVFPVFIVAGPARHDRVTRDQITAYMSGSGALSVKTVLESGTYTTFDSIRVTQITTDVVDIGGKDYLAAQLDCEIAGQG